MPETTQKPLITLPGPSSETVEKRDGTERRVYLRFPFTATAEVIDTHSGTRLLARASDLCIGGCYVDTPSPFAKGTTVRLRLNNDKQQLETLAVVAYSSAPMGMGLTFTEIQPDQLDILGSWMPKREGEPPSEKKMVVAGGPAAEADTIVSNPRLVLNELINLMVRKKLITENEGSGLLRKMFD